MESISCEKDGKDTILVLYPEKGPLIEKNMLEELLPYIEADGGSLQLVDIEEETGYVKVRLGGACESCAMSTMTLKQGIEKKLMMEIPDVVGVVQVL